MEHTRWYKNAVIYQIYPRSFCDGNGKYLSSMYRVDYVQPVDMFPMTAHCETVVNLRRNK